VILIAGWFLAGFVAAVLRRIHFNDLAMKSGFGGFVQNVGVNTDSAGFLASVAKWRASTWRAAARPRAATATRNMAGNSLALALCLIAGAGYAQPEKAPAPELSQRQADRIAERERIIACERQAREAKLPTAKRHDFIRACIKGPTAAAGGSEKK